MIARVVVISLVLLGCPRDRIMGGKCAVDGDCGSPASAFRCEQQTGVCYCRTDEACPPSQLCNGLGLSLGSSLDGELLAILVYEQLHPVAIAILVDRARAVLSLAI